MASCGPTFLSLLFLGQLEKCRQGRKEGPSPRSVTAQGEGIARPGVRCSVGISPLFWFPSSASGTSPYATTVPSALRASSGVTGGGPCLAAPRALQPRAPAPAPSTSTASGPSSCRGFLWGPALQPRHGPASGVAWPSVFCGGGLRPWAAQQREAGGWQGKHGPQRGARNSADSALLRPGRGSASPRWRPQGQGSAPPPLPCLRPPAGCGASPAAKDSGQGCWRPSSPHPLPQSTHSPCVAPLQACSQSPLL